MFEGSSPSILNLIEGTSSGEGRHLGRWEECHKTGVLWAGTIVQNTRHGLLLRVQSAVNSRRETAHGRSKKVSFGRYAMITHSKVREWACTTNDI